MIRKDEKTGKAEFKKYSNIVDNSLFFSGYNALIHIGIKDLLMKKKICIFLALTAIVLTAGCGSRHEIIPATEDIPTFKTEITPAPTPVPTVSAAAGTTASQGAPSAGTASAVPAPITTPAATPVPYSATVPVRTPAPTIQPQSSASSATVYTPAKTPAPASGFSPTPTALPANNKVKITKSPSGETLDEGGKAIFIATAENATKQVWILVSPDTKTTYKLEEAPAAFPGLSVDGQGTQKIHLYNIPYSMDGWRVQCYFEGNGGPAYTKGAYLTVKQTYQAPSDIFITTPSASSSGNPAEPGYNDAVNFASIVQRYGANVYFSSSGVQDYKYYSDLNFGEFRVTLTKGAVNLICTLRTYPNNRDCIPESLAWYSENNLQSNYIFGTSDPEAWNHLEKTILDIANYYGVGTAGQSMQLG